MIFTVFCVFLDLRSILKGLGRVWEGLERVWGGFWKGFKGGAIIFYIDFYNFCRFRGATLVCLRFGKVGKSSATKTSKLKSLKFPCGCRSLGHSPLHHGPAECAKRSAAPP